MSVMLHNPFPMDGVATYGEPLRTFLLSSMEAPRKELVRYLSAYERERDAYGGAIAIRGEFGFGKTHLLHWLTEEADSEIVQDIRQVQTLYAKADTPSLFDLYQNLMAQKNSAKRVVRQRVIQLRDAALKRIAAAQALEARATEGVAPRIADALDLSKLTEEGNVDMDRVTLDFEKRLAAQGVDNEFISVMRSIGLPHIGEVAYHWLAGEDIANPASLGVVSTLSGAAAGAASDAGLEQNGLRGIRFLAALHFLANVPLVVCIDQLEMLIPAGDPARIRSIGSLFMKLIEELRSQRALVFVTGPAEVWERLPTSVMDRFLTRPPYVLGRLDVLETSALLATYTLRLGTTFSGEAVEALQRVSGGSPRETLRIAYRTFWPVNGNLGEVTEDIVIDSAVSSGTLEEQERSAVASTMKVLSDYGTPARDEKIGDALVDVLLRRDDLPVVAVAFMAARNPTDESRTANRISRVLARLSAAHIPLILVSVAYSTPELIAKLGSQADVVAFGDGFAEKLDRRVRELVRENDRRVVKREALPPPADSAQLDDLRRSINELQRQREREAGSIEQSIAKSFAALRENVEVQRRDLTRQELLELLDAVERCLNVGDLAGERQNLRSVLVANALGKAEFKVQRAADLYLRILAAIGISNAEAVSRDSSHPQLDGMRHKLLVMMRRYLLQESSLIDLIVDRKALVAVIVGLILALLTAAFEHPRLTTQYAQMIGSTSLYSQSDVRVSDALGAPVWRRPTPSRATASPSSSATRSVTNTLTAAASGATFEVSVVSTLVGVAAGTLTYLALIWLTPLRRMRASAKRYFVRQG